MSMQQSGPVVFKAAPIPCLLTKHRPGLLGGFASGALATEGLPNARWPDGLPPQPTFSFPASSAHFAVAEDSHGPGAAQLASSSPSRFGQLSGTNRHGGELGCHWRCGAATLEG